MESKRKIVVGACCVASLLAVVRMKAVTAEDAGRKEIEAFNKRYVKLHLKMDTVWHFGAVGGGRSRFDAGRRGDDWKEENRGVGRRHRG